ncbi:MAG TPA: rhomboid family intramembrane serine protease [Candidatus Thermoplasmatota archaeon]|nr:rhomboid family intramembrane serine protease [Candidatus Thermoplasmatota archaeon]
MALVPTGAYPLAALAVTIVGLALVLRRGVPKAYGLGMVMMAVFLVDTIGRLTRHEGIQGQLGFRPTDLAWWSPLTSAFVHAPPGGASGRGGFFSIHLIGNLFILLTAGPALEERVGERKFLVIFGLAHLAALVVHVVMALTTPLIGLDTLALGASGGIFGVLAAFALRYPREKLPMLLLFFVFWMQASLVLLLYLAFNAVYFLSDYLAGSPSGIGWWAHFAGFFVGLAFARTLPASPATAEPAGSTRGLPDPEKLAPLATTPELKRLLERVRQFTPDARTAHDTTFATVWVDKFLDKATCPEGHAMSRSGLKATCSGGEHSVDLAR